MSFNVVMLDARFIKFVYFSAFILYVILAENDPYSRP
jgi:hypothetical protein